MWIMKYTLFSFPVFDSHSIYIISRTIYEASSPLCLEEEVKVTYFANKNGWQKPSSTI